MPSKESSTTVDSPRRSKSVKEFAATHGIGMTNAYKLLALGQLKAVKIGKLTRILPEDEAVWVASLAPFTPGA
jgi:hypothetical protein